MTRIGCPWAMSLTGDEFALDPPGPLWLGIARMVRSIPMAIDTTEIVRRAWQQGLAVPSFNIPHLPMMVAVVRALRDAECFGMIAVARLEWMKFESKSLQAIAAEYQRVQDPR